MFDKLKKLGQLNKLRQQARTLQKELEGIVETYEKNGIKVKVTGNQKLDYIEVGGESRDDIKDVINEAMKKVQKEAAKKMFEVGGGLTGLLGKI